MAPSAGCRPAARRFAVASGRVAVLSVHAAAGLAIAVDSQALRLLRSAEALVRLAVVRLESLRTRPPAGPAAAEGAAPAAAGDAAPGRTATRRRRRPKGKGNKVASEPDCGSAMDVQGCLEDEWADTLAVPAGPVPRLPHRLRQVPPGALPDAAHLPPPAVFRLSPSEGVLVVSNQPCSLPSWRVDFLARLPLDWPPEQRALAVGLAEWHASVLLGGGRAAPAAGCSGEGPRHMGSKHQCPPKG